MQVVITSRQKHDIKKKETLEIQDTSLSRHQAHHKHEQHEKHEEGFHTHEEGLQAHQESCQHINKSGMISRR